MMSYFRELELNRVNTLLRFRYNDGYPAPCLELFGSHDEISLQEVKNHPYRTSEIICIRVVNRYIH